MQLLYVLLWILINSLSAMQLLYVLLRIPGYFQAKLQATFFIPDYFHCALHFVCQPDSLLVYWSVATQRQIIVVLIPLIITCYILLLEL